jgi:hypothetical protein
VALLAGCTSVTGDPVAGDDSGAATASGTASSPASSSPPSDDFGRKCVAEGYPCNLADVPFDVIADSIELGGEAAALARIDGDADAAEALVRAHADVVDIDVTDEAITFRLAGGAPLMVFTVPTAVAGGDAEAASWEWPDSMTADGAEARHSDDADADDTETGPPGFRGAASAFAPGATGMLPREYQPAGETGQSHDEGPERTSVVIEPYGSMSTVASGRNFANIMERGVVDRADYVGKGSIHVHPNVLDVMTNLQQYDLIHISSHGWSGGVIGPQVTEDWYSSPDENGKRTQLVDLPDDVVLSVTCYEDKFGDYETPELVKDAVGELLGRGAGRCETRVSFGTDFFTTHYPGGLKDSLVFADWCQSTTDDSLRQVIAGTTGGYVGWSATVHLSTSAQASAWFWQYMSTGADPLTVVTKMQDEGRGVDRLFSYGARLESTGRDLRVRDAVTSFTTGDVRIAEHTPLLWSGDLGDDEPDTLDEISLVVEAVPAGQFDKLQLKMWIDDEQLPVTIEDFDAVMEQTGMEYWDNWTLTATDLPLPFDVTEERLGAGHPLLWRVEVTDDDDGKAAHQVPGVYLQGAGVEVSHPATMDRLADGARVDVDGVEGDGQPDSAPLVISVFDVPAEDVADHSVTVTLTGATLNGERQLEWPLSAFSEVSPGVYRKTETVQLDVDLTDANRPLTIDARLVRDIAQIDSHAPTVRLHGQEECGARVTYVMSDDPGEPLTMSWDCEGRYAQLQNDGQTIVDDSGMLICSYEDHDCTHVPGSGHNILPNAGFYQQIDDAQEALAQGEDAGTRTIAGIEAVCRTLNVAGADGRSIWCASPENPGLLLYWQDLDTGQSITATEVGKPRPGDFVPFGAR